MKIIMRIHATCNDDPNNEYSLGTFTKEVESEGVPFLGIKIGDAAWKDPKEVKNVTLDLTEDCYSVFLGFEPCSKDGYEELKEWYQSHGWS